MTAGRGSEWDLVEAAQAGDRDAFGRLYSRYADGVLGFVRARTGDPVLAQDLTQETFLRAWRRIDSVSYQGRDAGAWLTTIARNLVLDHVKSSRYQRERPVAEVRDADTGRDGPEQAVLRKETAAQLQHALAGLPGDQEECVRLRHLEELSVAQTAAVMGRTEAAVKGMTHRGVQHLRAAMGQESTVPAAAAAGGTATDPLAGARRAVAGVRQRRDAADRHAPDQEQAHRVARWHSDDQAAEARRRGRGAAASAAEGGAP